VCCSLPPDASAVAAVSSALAYLDSRAMAAFMKELAKCQQLSRAMEVFDWLKSLPQEHELYGLCDVYTFTTAISLMGPSQQLRRALELIGEMRARGLQCNVHTYSALMNVCIKVGAAASEYRGHPVAPAHCQHPRCSENRDPSVTGSICHIAARLAVLTFVAMPFCSVMRVTWHWMCSSRCMRTTSGPMW
jgi:hypothetical protein